MNERSPGLPSRATSTTTTSDDSQSSAPLSVPDLPPDADNLAAALAYAAAGWYVLPVKLSDKKHPGNVVGKNWQHKSSRDPQQIAAWFAGTPHGIALHCGRSGAVVFDVDTPDNLPNVLFNNLNAAPYQSTRADTPARGHYVFLQPPGRTIGNSTGQLDGGWGEVRGLNGVIIAEPSAHKEGGRYEWQRTGPVPPLPDDIAEQLNDASPAEDAVTEAAIAAFLKEHCGQERPVLLRGFAKALRNRFDAGESRHQSLIPALAGAMREAAAGFYPAAVAVAELKAMFLTEVAKSPASEKQSEPRTGDTALSEFNGILAWAVGQALAADPNETRARVDAKMPDDHAWIYDVTDPAEPIPLAEARAVFTRWLGTDYDTDALDAMLAAVAVERFNDGSDPIWLLLISGPGNAKTETVQACTGIDAVITSMISSEGALLSGTARKERTKKATGGLLRKIGDHGVLIIKDVTSILTMDRNMRGRVLAAFREIYDGSWFREVGADGGHTIEWHGRIAVIGAVTTAWDAAHAVVATMGDRFVLIRIDSTTGRIAAGRKAIGNTGSEPQMRQELAAAVAGVLAGMNTEPITLTDTETERLLTAANLVTRGRTGVEFDYQGNVIDAHAPEMPTRFAKQLAQIMRGGVAVGMDRPDALRLAIRCARDSMPPLRLAIIDDLATHPNSPTAEVRKRIDKPRTTVDRQLQALHMLGVVGVEEVPYDGGKKSVWFYTLADGINPKALTT